MAKKVVALAGGIGSGKSTAGRFCAQKGFKVVDCDEISREVAQKKEVLDGIARVFGERFVEQGQLNRRALAEEVFCDAQKTEKLNGIFHEEILRDLKAQIDREQGVVFVEIPLLEEKFLHLFDEIWLFIADKQNIINRVSTRDNRSHQQIEDILRRQKKYGTLQKSVVIANDGTLQELYDKLENMLGQVV